MDLAREPVAAAFVESQSWTSDGGVAFIDAMIRNDNNYDVETFEISCSFFRQRWRRNVILLGNYP